VRKNNFSNGAGAITDRTLEKQAFLIIPEGVAEVIFAHRLNKELVIEPMIMLPRRAPIPASRG